MTRRVLFTQAIKSAILDRGVAQLSVPNDIQKEPLEAGFCSRETCISLADYSIVPGNREMEKAVALIDKAEKPLILAG